MPKPITQRGFDVKKYNFKDINGGSMRYYIDADGLERIVISKDIYNEIWITSDGERIISFSFNTPQLRRTVYVDSVAVYSDSLRANLEQATKIYYEVKRILEVNEKMKKYRPRFSHESEFNLYNILGIDDISELRSLIKGR